MKALVTLTALTIFLLWGCKPVSNGNHEFDSASKVKTGTPVSVMLTSYSTTLLANGTAFTRMRIAVTDSLNREITSASDSVCVYVTGDGKVTTTGAKEMAYHKDTSGATYSTFQLADGVCHLLFVAGTTPDKVKVEAHVGKLWPGAHEIHTLPADFVFMKPVPIQIPQTSKKIDRMMGADISFLPEIEARGGSFSENDTLVDALALLKKHGFNYIRLRIFVNPGHEKGYAPEKGFCDLNHTLRMAKRVQEAGMKFLLDFHYSDYWADPQQQYKPAIWAELDFEQLKDSLHVYTYGVLKEFELQGTPPDMVQIGNEINHGILWPEGHISQPEQLAGLLKEGVQAVREFNPKVPVMMHLALGGQHEEAVFWLDNMMARGLDFDVIGISYYPRWHGTLYDLKSNLIELALQYKKPLNVVEYSDFKSEVHDIAFNLPNDLGKGACIWEPLNHRSGLFQRGGKATGLFGVYDEIKTKYLSE